MNIYIRTSEYYWYIITNIEIHLHTDTPRVETIFQNTPL